MLKSEPMGVGGGSGGELETGHVICPACAHNFAAIPQNAQERIAELEAAIRATLYMDERGHVACQFYPSENLADHAPVLTEVLAK